MGPRESTDQRATAIGLGLVLGAGLGTIVGLLVGGGSGIAIGSSIGAGLGLVIGSAWFTLGTRR